MTRTVLFFLFSIAALAQGGFNGPGRYEITSPLSRKVLDMDRNDQRTVIQYESRRTDNQVWDVTDAGGGYYYIRNTMNGNALAVQDDRNSTQLVAEPFNSSARQQWRFENGDNSTAILVNRNGKAIDIPYGSTNNGTKINSYGRNGEVNQRWQFQAAAGFSGGNNRYDATNTTANRGGRGRGRNRYDTSGSTQSSAPYSTGAASGQRDADGVYYDDRDRTYKMDGDGVCFYRDRDFQGEAVCATVRNGRSRWNSSSFTEIGSVRFFGRATGVQIFDREEFRGNSVEVTGEQRIFNRAMRNRLRGTPQSLRVY
ncbi:MAG: RICIN domain-containing protein [Bryobacteraceae bacterium]